MYMHMHMHMHACMHACVLAWLLACLPAFLLPVGCKVLGLRDLEMWRRCPAGGSWIPHRVGALATFFGFWGTGVGGWVRACGRACLLACLLACVRIYICMCVYISPCTQEFTELPRQEQSKGRDIDCRLMWMPGAQVLLERFCSVGPRRDAGFSGFSDVGF